MTRSNQKNKHKRRRGHATPGPATISRQKKCPARTVFNTPELLELIFLHCSIKALGCALSVSKYCREVVLRSSELRRTLFLDPAPATEHLEVVEQPAQLGGFPGLLHQYLLKQPSQTSLVVAKAHPILTSLVGDYRYLGCYFPATHAACLDVLRKIPPAVLLFQPPAPQVIFAYHGHSFRVERAQGVTFCAIFEELEKQRKHCQKLVNEAVKRRYTIYTRATYTYTMEQLNGPLRKDRSACQADCAGRCIYFQAEGSVMDDTQEVRMARNHVSFAGW